MIKYYILQYAENVRFFTYFNKEIEQDIIQDLYFNMHLHKKIVHFSSNHVHAHTHKHTHIHRHTHT